MKKWSRIFASLNKTPDETQPQSEHERLIEICRPVQLPSGKKRRKHRSVKSNRHGFHHSFVARAVIATTVSAAVLVGRPAAAQGVAKSKDHKITKVAPGALSARSTDAVNGSQLYATDQYVAILSAATGQGFKYIQSRLDDVNSSLDGFNTFEHAAIEYLNNLDNGVGVKYFHSNSSLNDSQAVGVNSVAMGPAAIAQSDGSVAIGNSVKADGGKSVAIGSGNISFGDGAISVGDPNFASGNGAMALGRNNIANSNGLQNASAANAANGAVALGNENKAIGQGSVAIGNKSTAGVAGAVAVGDTATVSAAKGVALGSNSLAANAGDVALGASSRTQAVVGTAAVTINGQSYAVAGSNPTSTVSVGDVDKERTITNVAGGRVTAGSTDAVNGSELYATNQAVESLRTSSGSAMNQLNQQTQQNNVAIQNLQQGKDGFFQVNAVGTTAKPSAVGTNSAAGGTGAVARGANSLALGTSTNAVANNAVALGANSVADRNNSVSVGSRGHERQVTNVAAGLSGTDAVNVNQLSAVKSGSVQYDVNPDGAVNTGSVTIGANGSAALIHNVAAGTNSTDAVNVGQLNQALTGATNSANSYTDKRVDRVRRDANAGTAAALAAANLPQAATPGRGMISAGVGSYRGEAALAIGVSHFSDSGRWMLKGSLTSDTRSTVGVGAGVGYQW
nr:YadA-like family protein [Candidatus Burkholderia verschuerenii]